MEAAIDSATAAGVVVVVAAGNDDMDACSFSPAHVGSAITVGATRSDDTRAWYSNYGSCLDVFAPGSSITSAGVSSDSASASMSGTSMACPHVAGAAALILQQEPNLTPSQVAERMRLVATPDAVKDPMTGSPNRLLYTGEPSAPSPTVAPEPMWQVTSGPCTMDAEACVQSPNYPNKYEANERCTITVKESSAVPIVVEHFQTERNYDKLEVDGVVYTGSQGPDGVTPKAVVTWYSDSSVQDKGWRLCPAKVTTQKPSTSTSSSTTTTSTSTTTSTTTTITTTTTSTTTTKASPPSNTPWSVTEGNGCIMDDESCVMSNNYPENYGTTEKCTIRVHQEVPLRVISFSTEPRYDELVVNGNTYSGTEGPRDGDVPKGEMTWESDSSITRKGWKICPIVPIATTSTSSPTSGTTSTTITSTSMSTTSTTSTSTTTTTTTSTASTTSASTTASTTSTTSSSSTSTVTSTTTTAADTTASTSTSPTSTSVNAPMWEVASGECTIDSNFCVMSPSFPSPYPPSQGCTILVHPERAQPIRVEHFETEEFYDTMAVNEVKYGGTAGPEGVVPVGNIKWFSDYAVGKSGWKLCPAEVPASMSSENSMTTIQR